MSQKMVKIRRVVSCSQPCNLTASIVIPVLIACPPHAYMQNTGSYTGRLAHGPPLRQNVYDNDNVGWPT